MKRKTFLAVGTGSFVVLALLAGESQGEPYATLDLAPLAYIGPGAGLGAIGALLAVLGAVVLCVAGLVLYPLQLLRNRLRGRDDKAGGPSSTPSA